MNKQLFLDLIEKLTGTPTPLRSISQTDEEFLVKILSTSRLKLNWNQFNELLLLCNKDRITKDFFDFFFRKRGELQEGGIDLSRLKKGVDKFRKFAMLAYGNFKFAYRELSKLEMEKIKEKLELYIDNSEEIERKLKARPRKVQRIHPIDREDTYFLGYLSSKEIGVDWNNVILLQTCSSKRNGHRYDKEAFSRLVDNCLEKLKRDVKKRATGKNLLAPLDRVLLPHKKVSYISEFLDHSSRRIKAITDEYFKSKPSKNMNEFNLFLEKSLESITHVKERVESAREKGQKNTDIYLTWDYMDVYFATSMRSRWEYESLSDFIRALFKNKDLRTLNLRYFDPTQSFEKNRIDKGLIEGLMLKRAKCTIYSIQETDTLGKDSELAATLAQGKPVIAYIPEISDLKEHTDLLKRQPLSFLMEKLKLLSETFKKGEVQSEYLKSGQFKNNGELGKFIGDFEEKIIDHISKKVWLSIETEWARDKNFKEKNAENFHKFCEVVAIADKDFYDERARILKESHPLAIQINLSNGVANGVLVVRKIDDCAKLLYNIITNRLEFDLGKNEEMDFWYLKERISQSIYRVVTGDKKITNSFWNFYLVKGE